ncbi:MAG: hypothetical protein AAGI23_07230 [Bacteroidota bacterium]
MAQSNDTIIQKMVEYEVLKRKEVARFEELLNLVHKFTDIEKRTKTIYLMGLHGLESEKLTGHELGNPTFPLLMPTVQFVGNIEDDEAKQKIIKQQQKYLLRLQDCGLIRQRHVDQFREKIESEPIPFRVVLLEKLYMQAEIAERLSFERLTNKIDKLNESGVCTSENYARLKQDLQSELIQEPIELIGYFDRGIVFDLTTYSENPDEYLEQIHRETASLLPDLDFNNFSYEVVVDKESSFPDYTFYEAIVSVQKDKNIYKQASYFAPPERRVEKDGSISYLGKIGTQNYYQLFNKMLFDQQSPYLLHYIESYSGNSLDDTKFGIVALTENQVKAVRILGLPMQLSYEKFNNVITSQRIAAALNAYKKVGLFNHLSEEELANSTNKAYQQTNRNVNDILSAFPHLILYFDGEMGNLDNPYEELVQLHKEFTRGDFQPTNVSGDFQLGIKKSCDIKFYFNGKHYQKQLRIDGDWVDADFFDFLQEVFEENKLPGKFYALEKEGLIYLTPEQYEYLYKNQFIYTFEDWINRDRD